MTARRSTWQKAAVKDALTRADVFISAQDLHKNLTEDNQRVGLTTVYRALAELAESGEADQLTTDEGEARYRVCHSPQHHHHLSCRVCGKAVEVKFAATEGWAEKLASDHGFSDVTHSIEVFGICSACGEN
jgi:Fe2+/Zn2+ uptake regulation proteins